MASTSKEKKMNNKNNVKLKTISGILVAILAILIIGQIVIANTFVATLVHDS
jgi:hypothetical protein